MFICNFLLLSLLFNDIIYEFHLKEIIFFPLDCERKSPSAVDYSDITELAEDAESAKSDDSESINGQLEVKGKALPVVSLFKMHIFYLYKCMFEQTLH